ncbi:ABC transporter ATP-binding protein [Mesobacillus subterraneus]|uniref:ABC transporter ATP-binding protein n=1 Tax=Mesobacillus subterraneus TaxID=285983 RepID=UPI001CFDFD61|nr:ABC transporter ATP-binding protein [Mesobacillus subterraneus]WLR54935.1 ABC transporter ATP-binding protein [Mesobacillus subterraneus]
MAILEINNLTIKHEDTALVNQVNISIGEGEWCALVGESGSGKSITASSIGGILPKELKVVSGSISYCGTNLTNHTEKEYRKIRGKEISYVFQDYQGAFTPFIKIGKQMDELLITHTPLSKQARKEASLSIFNEVNLPAERVYNSYPFQLSGGQLQRAAMAMAVVLKPKLLIADEPTTALDSMSAVRVLDMIAKLRKQTGCAVFFITHDLRHVKKFANQIAIMKKGKIVEQGGKESIFNNPQHDYTKQLFAALPPLRETPSRLFMMNENLV